MTTPSQLGRRSGVVVLVVIAAAVAMLGVLVVQTARQADYISLANGAGRQRMLSERVVAAALAAREGPVDSRALRRRDARATANEWRAAARELDDASTGAANDSGLSAIAARGALAPLRARVLAAAEAAASDSSGVTERDDLIATHRRFVAGVDELIARIERESDARIERLVHVEAACAILLLTALGFGVRLALLPTQEHLLSSVRALEESESRSRAVLEAMVEGMLLTDRTGRMLAWNASALRILGIGDARPADALPQAARRLTDAEGRLLGLENLPSRVVMRSGSALTGTVVGVAGESGVVRWLSVNTHPLFRAGGTEPYAAVSIFRDITEQRQLEDERAVQAEARELQNRELVAQAEALEREQSIFRSLVDTAGSAIVGLDHEGRVFEWNREAEQLYGVPRMAALGMSYLDTFVQLEHGTSIRHGIETVLAGESVRNFVAPVRAKRGGLRTVLWNVAPLRAGVGEPVHGIIATGVDITEREASDERFRILFDRSSDAQLLLDEHGVIDCNDATLRMLRYSSKAEVIGRRPVELSPHRQPDGRLSVIVDEQMRQIARSRGYHRFEWVHRREDGSEFPVEVTLTSVRLNGREVIMSSWHDIAERKALEDVLRAAKEAAESANRTKSDFMTRMNHELRTPLTAIIGFSRVLLQGKEGALSTGAARYAERIRANGLHLLSLINQILDVAKVEAGRMELDCEAVHVDALVHDTLAMLEATAEAKGLTLHREVPTRVAPIVTDGGKLRQILINLVGNAIKFTATGEVRVIVETDALTGRPLAIVVRDTGIGIAPERLARVFDPFEQGDSSTRREFGGTGLGLSIVKAFADLIGGAISVTSEPGRGSAFTLLLPTHDQTISVEPRAKSA